MLEDEDYLVEDAEDADGALALARRHRPDLILLEGETAPGGGVELAARIKARPEFANVPVILVTEPEERDLALSLGVDGVLERPLEPRRFVRRLKGFLRGRRDRVSAATRSRHLQAYSQDLVERLQRHVEELSQANRRLRRVDDLKNELIEGFCRELSTPLTPLLGLHGLLESGRLGPLTPRQRRALHSLGHALRRLGETVDNLLDLAAFEEIPDAEAESFDLVEVGRAAVRALREKARSRRILIEAHLPAEARAHGDRTQVGRAVVHLLDHAVRAAPRGGYVLLEITGEEEGWTRLSVYDSGPAIESEALPYVFEPFFVARPLSGGGLSPGSVLALVRRIAECQGGRMEVESPPRAHPSVDHDYPGAKFSMLLPQEPTAR